MIFLRGSLSRFGFVFIYIFILGAIFVLKKSSVTVIPTCIVIKELQEIVETQSQLIPQTKKLNVQFHPSSNIFLDKDKHIKKNLSFNHLLYPEFPLGEALVNPQPGLSIGNIGLDAKIIIGIPTVKREGVSYLEHTLASMFENMNASSHTKVVVYIGESDEEFIKESMENLSTKFSNELRKSMLQVISPPSMYYPIEWTTNLHLQFGDKAERVKWRSKQNLDQVKITLIKKLTR